MTTAQLQTRFGFGVGLPSAMLLAALENAEEEIARLKVLVGKLHKIVNLASFTKCDHKCFTKKTQSHLLALLEEARAVV